MTPQEISARIRDIKQKTGGRAYVMVSISENSDSDTPILCSLYLKGLAEKATSCGHHATFESALDAMDKAVDDDRVKSRDIEIRAMALSIIDHANGAGEISRNDLYKGDFSALDVMELFPRALELAGSLISQSIVEKA